MDDETHEPADSLKSEAASFARATMGVSVAIATLVFMLGLAGALVKEAGVTETRAFAGNFGLVVPGMHRKELIALLGRPDGQTDRLYLGQRRGFEVESQAATASRSSYFLFWRRGTVYSVGLTTEDRVAFKATSRK